MPQDQGCQTYPQTLAAQPQSDGLCSGFRWEHLGSQICAYLVCVVSRLDFEPAKQCVVVAVAWHSFRHGRLGRRIAIAEVAAHFGQRLVIIGTCLVSVLLCPLAVTTGGKTTVVLPLLALVQITSFADVGALSSGAVTAADPARRGAALAIYAFIGNLSGFLATAMVGAAIEWFGGARSATGWSAAFVTMALGSTVAAYAVHRVRDRPEYLPDRQQPQYTTRDGRE